MSEQKKPREYALTGLHLTIGNADNPDAEIRIATLLKPNTTITGDIVKVIEYSAFHAAQEKIKELEVELDFLKSDPSMQYTVQMYSELSEANKKLIDDLMSAFTSIKNNKDTK